MSTQPTKANEIPAQSPTLEISVTKDAIAERAYALFLARGGEHGHDVQDWLQAERELEEDLNNAKEDPVNRQIRVQRADETN